MRRPRMSTGAWIFTGLVCAAVIAPASVYAASITKVALVGSGSTHGATVTTQGQLLTTSMSPGRVIHAVATTATNTSCQAVYTPPANKAIVVTSVSYTFGSGTQGAENYGGLFSKSCDAIYDQIDGVQAFDTVERTYPTGLPMNGVAVNSTGGSITVFVVGYLIDASSLPSSAGSQTHGSAKALSRVGPGH
jgi:hypothetical protein